MIHIIEQTIQPVFVEQLGYSRTEAYRFLTVLAEICQNIYYHSVLRGDFNGYIMLHADQTSLKFLAMDLGSGISTTLKTRYQFKNDDEAILLACQAGVTSKGSGGLGLYRIMQIVKQAGGQMQIRSGNSRDGSSAAGNSAAPGNVWSHEYTQGTQIGILLPRNDAE